MKKVSIITYIIITICFKFSFAQERYELAPGAMVYKYNAKGLETLNNVVITLALWGDEWFLYTPAGQFDGSEEGLKRVTITTDSGKLTASSELSDFNKGLAWKVFDTYALDVFAESVGKRVKPASVDEIVYRPRIVVDPLAHTDEIMDLLYSPALNALVTLSKDKTIRIWDIETGENIRTFYPYSNAPEEGQFYRGALANDGKTLFAGGFMDRNKGKYVGDIKIYDLVKGKQTGVLSGSDNSLNSIAYAGTTIAAGFNNKSLFLYSIFDATWAVTKKSITKNPSVVFESDVSGVSLTPDGKRVVVSRFASKSIYLADIGITDNAVVVLNEKKLDPKHSQGLVTVTFSPDGNYILSADPAETHLWDKNGNYIRLFAKRSISTEGIIRFSPDGKKVLIANVVYSFPEGVEITNFRKSNISNKVSVFIDNNTVASSTLDNEIILWNANDGKEKNIFGKRKNIAKGIAFTSEGFKIAISNFLPFDKAGKPTEYKPETFIALFDFDRIRLETTVLPDKPLSNNLVYSSNGITISRVSTPNKLDLDVLKVGEQYINGDRKYGTASSFSFTPQGHVLVGFTLYLVLFNNTGQEIKRFVGHTGGIEAMAISPDGNFAATLGSDQTIRLWNLNDPGRRINKILTVKPMATLYINSDNEWICYNTENYYASSKKGAKFIGFVENISPFENAQFHTFEKFDLAINRPDILLRSLGSKNENLLNALNAAYQKRLKRYQLSEDKIRLSTNGPILEILNVSGISQSQQFELSLNISSYKLPVTAFEVFINDVRVLSSIENAKQINKKINLTLAEGKNKIQAFAYDSQGNKSTLETIRILYKPTQSKLPVLYMVTLTVANYKESDYNLAYPNKDAADLIAQFQQAKGKIFSDIKILNLKDNQVTQNAITIIKNFLKASSVNDYVIIFTAGHGIIANKTWYFATYDINFSQPQLTGIDYDSLEGVFNEIPARNRLMLIDACHSGELDVFESDANINSIYPSGIKSRGFKTTKTTNAISFTDYYWLNNLFPDLNKNTGAIIISAAASSEFAFESPEWKNGVFTYSLVEGIRTLNADKNTDKQIKVSELRNYVAKRVAELTNGRQNPTGRTENIEIDFRVW